MKFLLIFSTFLLLCGCLPKNYIEQLGIITSAGYDKLEDNKISGTLVIYQFNPSSPNISQVISSEGETLKGVRLNADRKTSHKLVSGQIRLDMYGRKIAEEGLMRYMDTLSRDAKISDMGYIVIADDRASSLLNSINTEDSPNMGTYVQRLVEKSIKRELIPDCSLHEFNHILSDKGIDPVLPLMSKENNKVVIKGLGLLKDDQLVGEIPDQDVFYLMLMQNDLKKGQFQIQLSNKTFSKYLRSISKEKYKNDPLFLSFSEINSNIHISTKEGEAAHPTVKIQLKARLLESSKDLDFKQKKMVKDIEKEVENKITEKLNQLTTSFKEAQVDPLGFGRAYNSENRNDQLSKKELRQIIPDINPEFKVSFKLLRHGITE
ncbi:Ger(x)C family spore germination protein [Halobacillus salinarum]|uniref:Ger(X)C family spore germination protein n=1 Tax=Halobacillus salinarum TaxID=2932257 RepID=A0ABY4EGJ5_9BACI|nr:Ger(x)C family spore germination protein [Halobacillus salinarum]UOQ43599.1 Ger(x)C family spore germination protein [Halobacillus salinarum]